MSWTLIISMYWAISGYQTKDDCWGAAKELKGTWATLACVPTPNNGKVIGGRG